MASVSAESKPRLLQYLKRLAPFSVVDKGITYALDGKVVECGKVHSTITAVVRAQNDEDFSVTLEVVSANRVSANCRCSTREEMAEQWCPHAIAVLWRASDLGFFEPHSGFATTESAFRVNTSSPEEIASVLNKLKETPPLREAQQIIESPEVSILISPSGDRLGLEVRFNDEIQEPHIFESFTKRSSRTLDNLLLQLLEDSGSWDDEGKIWFVNSSNHIESILGLLDEFKNVLVSPSNKPLIISEEQLEAHIGVEWQESAADLSLTWKLPPAKGKKKPKLIERDGELIGTGPFWCLIENTIYPVSQTASMLAALFPHGPRLSVQKRKMGPILEELSHGDSHSSVIVSNPKEQPDTTVKPPTPRIDIWSEDEDLADGRISTSSDELSLHASLEFQYPESPKGKNIVYLPHREKEQEYYDLLNSLGFEHVRDQQRFLIKGDAALDLIEKGNKVFAKPWVATGLDVIQQKIKFAKLNLNVSVTKSDSAEDKKGAIDWFHCKVSLTQNNANIPLSTLFRSGNVAGDRWIKLDSGAYAKVPAGGLNRLQSTLGFLEPNFKLSNSIKSRLRPAQALGLLQADDEGVQFSSDKSFQNLSGRIKNFSRIETIKQTKAFKGKLRNYQTDGLSWMNFLHQYELGGILADEMGLGKTVQTLAFLQYQKEGRSSTRNLKHPALIVAPTSVIVNWQYEAERFTPHLSTMLLHGAKRHAKFSQIKDHDIVITSYALLRNDRAALQELRFSYIVLDEAQNIKNPKAATTQAAKAIRADHRLALTGTPTENRPLALWSIFDFLMPGYLGSNEFFRNHLEKPILEGTEKGQETAALLNKKTRPFILRRLKDDVEKDLPKKIETDLHVPMTESQIELYTQILEEVRPKVFEAIAEKGVRGAGVSILAAMLRLRQVCNHPNSIDGLQDLPNFDSGKFNLFKEVIKEALESGRKILVFSQFREMLRLIKEFLDSISAEYLYLDGGTKNRQDLVDKFNSDNDVRLFVISLKAGGTGLNLTAQAPLGYFF